MKCVAGASQGKKALEVEPSSSGFARESGAYNEATSVAGFEEAGLSGKAMNAQFIYSFDGFRIDPARRELWRGSEKVAIQPKAFECLAYLIQNRDRAVGRDELIAAVWGKVDASDRGLTLAIRRARQAVGDTDEEHRIISTIPSVGYSWGVTVEEVAASAPINGRSLAGGDGNDDYRREPAVQAEANTTGSQVAHSIPAASASQLPIRWRRPLLVAVALALLILVIWAAVQRAQPPKPIDGEMAMVLPVSVSGDDTVSWMRLGLMDLIAERLRAAGQHVTPSDNTVALVRGFDDTAQPTLAELEAAAQAAAVGVIMEVSAERTDDRWFVFLRTVRGRDRPLIAQGHGEDILTAARGAADHMAQLLGYVRPVNDDIPVDGSLEYLLQQVKAASLAQQSEEIRELYLSAAPEHQADPWMRYYAAWADIYADRDQEALAALEALLSDLPANEQHVLQARVRYGLAIANIRSHGREGYTVAEEQLSQAIGLVENDDRYDARHIFGVALSARGTVRSYLKRHGAALSDFARARFALESVGDQLALINFNNNTGAVHLLARRYDEAISYFEQAADRARSFQLLSLELTARGNLVRANLELLDPGRAVEQEPRIRELLQQPFPWSDKTNSWLRLCRALVESGRLKDAAELLQPVLDATDTNYAAREPMARAMAASIAWTSGRFEDARKESAMALEHEWWQQGRADYLLASTYLTHLRANLALADRSGAAAIAADAFAWSQALPEPDPVAATYAALIAAEHAAASGDAEAAAKAFMEAHRQAEAAQMPQLLLEVAQSHAPWLIEQGDAGAAAVAAGRIARWARRHYDAALLQLRVHHALGDTAPWRNALRDVQALAGEREIPPELLVAPSRSSAAIATTISR